MAKAVISMTISFGVLIFIAYWNSFVESKCTSTSM